MSCSRALGDDVLPPGLNGDPNGYPIGKGADLFISMWNLHRCALQPAGIAAFFTETRQHTVALLRCGAAGYPETTQLGRLHVNDQHAVGMPPTAHHSSLPPRSSPHLWKDPDAFRPERFTGGCHMHVFVDIRGGCGWPLLRGSGPLLAPAMHARQPRFTHSTNTPCLRAERFENPGFGGKSGLPLRVALGIVETHLFSPCRAV